MTADEVADYRDAMREARMLRSALERTLNNFKLLLAQKPVRDASETIGEAEQALRR